MDPLAAEFLGTLVLIAIGNGTNANVLLAGTKGHASGWLVITTGWGLGVFFAVALAGEHSGAHLNPAVTLSLAMSGSFAWADVAGYMAAQLLGAFAGAAAVFLTFRDHFVATGDQGAKQACFCTAPALPGAIQNTACEAFATWLLLLAVLMASPEPTGFATLGAIKVGLIVFAIGIGMGGTTGYAINPARDLGPRLAHALLPIPRKGGSGWNYAWVPIVGPLLGSLLAVATVEWLGTESA